MTQPEILPEVKLKLTRGGAGDQVIILENIPKKFFYTTTRNQVPRKNRDGELMGETMPGTEMIEVLKERLEESHDGRGFIQMEIRNPDMTVLYKSLMNYVERTLPRGEIIPKPVPFSSMPGHPMANPIDDTQIPRVTLPVSPPPSVQKTVEAGTPSILEDEKLKEKQDRMAHARAAKKPKTKV